MICMNPGGRLSEIVRKGVVLNPKSLSNRYSLDPRGHGCSLAAGLREDGADIEGIGHNMDYTIHYRHCMRHVEGARAQPSDENAS